MQINELKAQGIAARATGALSDLFADTPHLDKFTAVAKACRDADSEERAELQQAIYADMYAYAEKLADQVKRLRELEGPGLSKPTRVSGILNDCILALESEGFGS